MNKYKLSFLVASIAAIVGCDGGSSGDYPVLGKVVIESKTNESDQTIEGSENVNPKDTDSGITDALREVTPDLSNEKNKTPTPIAPIGFIVPDTRNPDQVTHSESEQPVPDAPRPSIPQPAGQGDVSGNDTTLPAQPNVDGSKEAVAPEASQSSLPEPSSPDLNAPESLQPAGQGDVSGNDTTLLAQSNVDGSKEAVAPDAPQSSLPEPSSPDLNVLESPQPAGQGDVSGNDTTLPAQPNIDGSKEAVAPEAPQTGLPDSGSPDLNAPETLQSDGQGDTVSKPIQQEPQPVVLTELDTLRNRVIPDLIDEEKAAAIRQSTTVESLANKYLMDIQVDGRWLDIDYQSDSMFKRPVETHLERLATIAVAYNTSNNQKLKESLINALEVWFGLNFASESLEQEVEVTHSLATIALLLSNELPDVLNQQVIAALPILPNTQKTGIQRINIATGVIYRGLLSKDESLVGVGLNNIAQTVKQLSNEVDANNPDWSALLSSNNVSFGRKFYDSVLTWAFRVRDLQWKFSDSEVLTLTSILLDGIRWMGRFGELDHHISGNSSATTLPVITSIDMVAALRPHRADEVLAYKSHVAEGKTSGINGFKYFPNSDYSVTATDDFMYSIKMNSVRSAATQTSSSLGNWSGFGSAFLMQSGHEYKDIFPVWDGAKVPGVTAPNYLQASSYDNETMRNTVFVGGVTFDSKGTLNPSVGISTMALDMSARRPTGVSADGYTWTLSNTIRETLQAHKSWFSFGDQILALGSGINSTYSQEVYSTLNQSLWNGPVTLSNSSNLELGDHDVSTSRWVHHDNVGYVFLDDSARTASVQNKIKTEYSYMPGEPVNQISKEVFTLTIPHGTEPKESSYQYIVLPARTAQQTMDYQQHIPLKVLANTRQVHAVENITNNTISVVFFEAGELEISPEFKIKVDSPCAFIFDRNSLDHSMVLSTPGKAYHAVSVTVIENGVSTTQRVVTPGAEEKVGSSISFDFTYGQDSSVLNDPLAYQAYMTFLPVEDVFVQGGPSANTEYGLNGYMQIKNAEFQNNRHSLVRYDLSKAVGSYSKATLRLYVRGIINQGGNKSAIVAKLAETTSWSEKTTYETYPTVTVSKESNPVYVGEEVLGQWIEIDVTDLITSVEQHKRDNIIFELADLAPDYYKNYISFATREFGYKGPQLVLK